ncbi:MAG: M23 family metallopeptidase [Pseudomonadota bacterium]
MIGLRETLLALFLWLGQDPVSADITSVSEAEPPAISCQGQAVQAGLLICSAPTATHLDISGVNGEASRRIPVNADGLATVGLLRTEAETIQITIVGASSPPLTLDVATRTDPFRIIEGMDCDKVDARTDAQKAHAGRSWVKKQDAFERFEVGQGGVNGFARPARGRMSSPFGPARKYIGVGVDGVPCERTRIHYGYDIATPVGTPIYAPAAGIVTLGDPDLYYEGGTIFLDHGEGLVSVFMHMSEIQVEAGQLIAVGEQIGLSGNTGRTTGPHLHWAVKWRNPSSDDRSADFYIDPALLMQMDPVDFETPASGQE